MLSESLMLDFFQSYFAADFFKNESSCLRKVFFIKKFLTAEKKVVWVVKPLRKLWLVLWPQCL